MFRYMSSEISDFDAGCTLVNLVVGWKSGAVGVEPTRANAFAIICRLCEARSLCPFEEIASL